MDGFDHARSAEALRLAREQKIKERLAYIKKHPEAVIRIDPMRIYEVLGADYVMRCGLNSSVAHNRAIKTSDIDGGVIITVDPVSLDTQDGVIAYLREVGFDVYSPAEVDAADLQLRDITLRVSSPEWAEAAKRSKRGIDFFTLQQITEGNVPLTKIHNVRTGPIIARHGNIAI